MSKFVKVAAVCSVLIALSLFAHETKQHLDSNAYSHGTIACLKGNDLPGLRLLLTQKKTCEGRLSYPRLEIDIREQSVPVRKSIVIGPDNLAFRCLNPKESCEQLVSGELVFEHFEDGARKFQGGLCGNVLGPTRCKGCPGTRCKDVLGTRKHRKGRKTLSITRVLPDLRMMLVSHV